MADFDALALAEKLALCERVADVCADVGDEAWQAGMLKESWFAYQFADLSSEELKEKVDQLHEAFTVAADWRQRDSELIRSTLVKHEFFFRPDAACKETCDICARRTALAEKYTNKIRQIFGWTQWDWSAHYAKNPIFYFSSASDGFNEEYWRHLRKNFEENQKELQRCIESMRLIAVPRLRWFW